MKRFTRVTICTLLFAAVLNSPSPADDGGTLLITGARILDVVQGRLSSAQMILIREGRISQIAAQIDEPADQALALDGLVLIPGLIDLHSHLLLHPYDEASWNDQVLKESLELRTIRGVRAARRTLDAGFTTLRDLGTEGAGFADVALRDAIDQGMIPGPRVFASTRALVTSGGYGPSGFDPRWPIPKGAQVVDGPAAARRATRQQIAAGADWIKIYADYRRRAGGPSTPTFSMDELKAIVDEARTAGLPVAAHATTDLGIRRAVEAGVDTIEHGYQATPEALRIMRARGVALCPTLAASEAMARYAGWKPGQTHARIETARQLMRNALAAKVVIACGSDVGVFAHGDNARELELMHDYGMSRADTLRSATVVAARVLRRENELGQIAPQFFADLVAVRGNPLDDLKAVRNVVVVVKDGQIIVDRRTHP